LYLISCRFLLSSIIESAHLPRQLRTVDPIGLGHAPPGMANEPVHGVKRARKARASWLGACWTKAPFHPGAQGCLKVLAGGLDSRPWHRQASRQDLLDRLEMQPNLGLASSGGNCQAALLRCWIQARKQRSCCGRVGLKGQPAEDSCMVGHISCQRSRDWRCFRCVWIGISHGFPKR
jgi:hypothetical protein